eukprot:scaffold269666_cov27-Tisochrysis_lutea.AAC.1
MFGGVRVAIPCASVALQVDLPSQGRKMMSLTTHARFDIRCGSSRHRSNMYLSIPEPMKREHVVHAHMVSRLFAVLLCKLGMGRCTLLKHSNARRAIGA